MNIEEYKKEYQILQNEERKVWHKQGKLQRDFLNDVSVCPFCIGDVLKDSLGRRFQLTTWRLKNKDPKSFMFPQIEFNLLELPNRDRVLVVSNEAIRKFTSNAPPPRIIKNEKGEKKTEPGFVYLIQMTGTNFYKIGVASCVERRVKEIQTSNPHEIKIIQTCEFRNPYAIENKIHKKLKKNRKQGEWFELNETDVDVICTRYLKEPKNKAA